MSLVLPGRGSNLQPPITKRQADALPLSVDWTIVTALQMPFFFCYKEEQLNHNRQYTCNKQSKCKASSFLFPNARQDPPAANWTKREKQTKKKKKKKKKKKGSQRAATRLLKEHTTPRVVDLLNFITVHGQVLCQNPLFQSRFICPNIDIFLISR